ncbi:hypothetical protein VAR608DRAFT_1548 [Variovorax sp. HW608]|nr:hypothetical protein VAR608DRAFT_1548 [Variovorax sp. HW608]
MAVAVYVDDIFLLRLDAHGTYREGGVVAGPHVAISTRWPSMGTLADHFNSRSMR